MSGILGTKASLIYDINLLLQIAILLLLLLGYKFKRDKNLMRHGLTMAVAVILHTIAILLVMIPSFITYFGILLRDTASPGVTITWVHAIMGILAEILGIFLVAIWRFRPQPKMACAKWRWLMKPLLALWTFALILGIAFYAYYYL